MAGEFYKMDFEAWDEGTDELTLEQEAAYLRLCHQLYRRKAAIPSAPSTLARIWRCHPNKARKLLSDLVAAGKVLEQAGYLSNTRVTRELHERETRRTQQADAGHTGGTHAQDNRRKALKTNDADVAVASTPVEAKSSRERERERERGRDQIEASPPSDARTSDGFPDRAFDLFWTEYPNKVGKDAARKAFDIVRRSRRVTMAALMAGLSRYIASKPPTREWCHPTTWLNQGRWADEPAPGPQSGEGRQGARASPRSSSADLWAGDAFSAHDERQRGSDVEYPFHDSRTGGENPGDSRRHPTMPGAHNGIGRLPPQQPGDDPGQLPPLRLVGSKRAHG